MEQAETAQKEVARSINSWPKFRSLSLIETAQLRAREQNLKRELQELESNRGELAAALDEASRGRYERLLRSKGENVVVGIQHGVCGGCHMRIPPQLLVLCRGAKELVTCSNCGRILYYTRDMDLAVAE
jgi:predicted  nucleic acid-binding Zn-ribbon protein